MNDDNSNKCLDFTKDDELRLTQQNFIWDLWNC